MTATEVEKLARDVIVHRGLPFTVLSVIGSPAGWAISVRGGNGAMVRFVVLGTRADFIRQAILDTLEADDY